MDLNSKQGRREQGQRIQRAVERASLSIEELAGRIGCSRALIYQYLSGTTLAQPDRLQRIAQECGVSLAFFYEEEIAESQAEPSAPNHPQTTASSPETSARNRETLNLLQALANAQESPPDYRALAATCERILALVSQQNDKAAQAQAQKRLGNARLRMAEYPRAAEALRRAIADAQEIGDIVIETGARQSLGNALLAMGRISEAREQFSKIAEGSLIEGRWQGTLSMGCIHEMQGEYQKAMARFDDAAAILEEGEANGALRPESVAIAMLYVNTNRRNVYMDGGDFRGAHPLAEQGMNAAEALGNADQHLEARFDKAWCDAYLGRWRSAYQGFGTTLQLARFLGDQGRECMSRAWRALLLAAAGDCENAILNGNEALALALQRGDRRAELYAQLALADAHMVTANRDSEARYHTNQALAVTVALRYERGEIECRLRLARLATQTRDAMELYDAASRSLALAERLGARHLESLARIWLAEALLQEAEGVSEPDLRVVREHLQRALAIAEETGCLEAKWRSYDLLAKSAQGAEEEESALKAGVALLEEIREEIRAAELPDTLLESEECFGLYVRLAQLLQREGRQGECAAFLEQAGWPPLKSKV